MTIPWQRSPRMGLPFAILLCRARDQPALESAVLNQSHQLIDTQVNLVVIEQDVRSSLRSTAGMMARIEMSPAGQQRVQQAVQDVLAQVTQHGIAAESVVAALG